MHFLSIVSYGLERLDSILGGVPVCALACVLACAEVNNADRNEGAPSGSDCV